MTARAIRCVLGAALGTVAIVAGISATAAPAAAEGPVMRAHFIDVGQSDATLLEFPCGLMLIDAGGEVNLDFDGRAALLGYLERFFAANPDREPVLDLLALTHPHIDHTAVLRDVVRVYRPKNVLHDDFAFRASGNRAQRGLQRYTETFEEVSVHKVHLSDIPAEDGQTGPVIDPIRCAGTDPVIRVLWGRVEENPGWDEFEDANNHSLVLRIDYGKASFLFTGDLETEAIESLLERTEGTGLLDVDVYQVGHHASRNGTTPELVEAMSPQLAVSSNGPPCREGMDWNGGHWTAWGYGHPNKGVVETLAEGVAMSRPETTVEVGKRRHTFETIELDKAVYSTGWDGTVIVTATAGGELSVETLGQARQGCSG